MASHLQDFLEDFQDVEKFKPPPSFYQGWIDYITRLAELIEANPVIIVLFFLVVAVMLFIILPKLPLKIPKILHLPVAFFLTILIFTGIAALAGVIAPPLGG